MELKIEQQVCTLEQSKKLKELLNKFDNVYQPQFWYLWNGSYKNKDGTDGYFIQYCPNGIDIGWSGYYPAYTVAELGEMLPGEVVKMFDFAGYERPKSGEYTLGLEMWQFPVSGGVKWGIDYRYENNININVGTLHGTEAETRAAMLIYLLENNLHTL